MIIESSQIWIHPQKQSIQDPSNKHNRTAPNYYVQLKLKLQKGTYSILIRPTLFKFNAQRTYRVTAIIHC